MCRGGKLFTTSLPYFCTMKSNMTGGKLCTKEVCNIYSQESKQCMILFLYDKKQHDGGKIYLHSVKSTVKGWKLPTNSVTCFYTTKRNTMGGRFSYTVKSNVIEWKSTYNQCDMFLYNKKQHDAWKIVYK